jgi:sulfate adenylyltransferase subunit 1
VLVDVRKGVLDQTRRHLAVAALLRVPHVIVVVNKIDLVDHDETAYRTVAAQVAELATGLGLEDVRTVPTSALGGDNIVERSPRTPWYDGPALLELLEQLPTAAGTAEESLRFPVQRVIRPQSAAVDERYREYRGYAGRVASGVVRPGDEVVVLPSGTRTRVAGVDTADGELTEAAVGRSVVLRLTDDVDVTRGDAIVAAEHAPAVVKEAQAMLCWLAEVPLRGGQRVLLKHGSATVQAIVTQIDGRLDLDALALRPAAAFDLNDIGQVSLRLARPLPLEDYRGSRSGGAFVLIDPVSGGTLAAGMAREPGRTSGLEWEI